MKLKLILISLICVGQAQANRFEVVTGGCSVGAAFLLQSTHRQAAQLLGIGGAAMLTLAAIDVDLDDKSYFKGVKTIIDTIAGFAAIASYSTLAISIGLAVADETPVETALDRMAKGVRLIKKDLLGRDKGWFQNLSEKCNDLI